MKTETIISDDRCVGALIPILLQGDNKLKTHVVCASLFEQNPWHLFKIGEVTLNLHMRDQNITTGSICIHKGLRYPSEDDISYNIENIAGGLSGGCVSVLIRKNTRKIKLYLNLPLVIHGDPGLSALFAITGRYNSVREPETRLYNWLSALK